MTDFNEDFLKFSDVLMRARKRVFAGKGRERHGQGNKPFTEQPMIVASSLLQSRDGMLYQIVKKAVEAKHLSADDAEKELLDIINYAVGCILYIREKE